MANIPADIMYLYGYAMSKQTLISTNFGKKHPNLVHMLSGALGDFFSIVTVVPLEIVSQRLQIQDARIRAQEEARKLSPNSNLEPIKPQTGVQILKKIAKEDGIRGLYRGVHLSLALFLPSSATWWGVSEFVKKPAAKAWGVKETNVLAHATAGATAGFVTSLMMNPVDVVKTRLQTSPVKTTGFRVVKELAIHGGFFCILSWNCASNHWCNPSVCHGHGNI